MESKHIFEVEKMKRETRQLTKDLNLKMEGLSRSRLEALTDELVTFCFYAGRLTYKAGRLTYKKALEDVATKYPNHPLDFKSFSKYTADLSREQGTLSSDQHSVPSLLQFVFSSSLKSSSSVSSFFESLSA
ncbi:hypothetical protein ACH5RR_006606 [Cinchona calisaya]|uniref:Uncharacterized protein n=1 Tax=Cinchona calisaya TaxID=153742 RepID=A0ABD3APH1_9GENT